MTALYIALFGALGSLARYGVSIATARLVERTWLGTFTVNIIGSLAIGAVVGWFAATGQLDSRLRIAITTGLLGGFTTYSAFALETVAMLEKRQTGAAFSYIAATLVVAGLACLLGLVLGRRLG